MIKKILWGDTKTGDSLRRGDVVAYDNLQQSVVFLRFNNRTSSWDCLTIANMMSLSFPLSYYGSNGQSVSYYCKSLLFKEFALLIADLSGFWGAEKIYQPQSRFNNSSYQFAFRLI